MDSATVLGLVAGTLTTLSFIPQVAKVWKSRHARDISLPMYAIFCAGVFLWAVYGFATGSAPVIAANLVTLMLAGAILLMKVRFH